MAIEGKLIGLEGFKSKLKRIDGAVNRGAKMEMGKLIAEMHEEVVTTISRGGRSGRVYGNHQASAPGEAPKTDTGELVASMRPSVLSTKRHIEGTISADAKHAAPLEFKPASRGGRPFMRPLYKRWRRRITKRLEHNIMVYVRRV